MGYDLAGFEIVGVDNEPQPRYPFEFYLADALNFPLDGFDVIHASPPCQAYSHLTPKEFRGNHEKSINSVRQKLIRSMKHYIIENVAGAKKELNDPIMLCGSMFGLRCQRHRYFETSFPVEVAMQCNHAQVPLLVTTASQASRKLRKKLGILPKTIKNAPLAYGIDWMDFKGLKECIPPAYTEFIGKQFIRHITSRRLK